MKFMLLIWLSTWLCKWGLFSIPPSIEQSPEVHFFQLIVSDCYFFPIPFLYFLLFLFFLLDLGVVPISSYDLNTLTSKIENSSVIFSLVPTKWCSLLIWNKIHGIKFYCLFEGGKGAFAGFVFQMVLIEMQCFLQSETICYGIDARVSSLREIDDGWIGIPGLLGINSKAERSGNGLVLIFQFLDFFYNRVWIWIGGIDLLNVIP